MNYHFCVDDKFIDKFILDANEVSDNNIYIFVFEKNNAKYVKYKGGIYAPFKSNKFIEVITKITQDDKVFFHPYMQELSNKIIHSIPKRTKVYTMFWGSEFLQLPPNCGYNNKISKFLYEPKTLQYVKKTTPKPLKGIFKSLIESIKKLNPKIFIFRLFYSKMNEWKYMKTRRDFLKRITAICHWNRLDVDILEKLYNTKVQQKKFCYDVFIDSVTELPERSIKKELIILLGNSDTPTNNHLEAFDLLKKFKDDNIKIYCPLSYHKKEYAYFIAKKGEEFFGDKFIPILDFLPVEKYYEMINDVDICFMNHNRTQAAGNILVLIKTGAKIFINSKSTIYKLCKNLGIKVYATDDILNLSFEELQKNQEKDISLKNYKLFKDYLLRDKLENLQNLLK